MDSAPAVSSALLRRSTTTSPGLGNMSDDCFPAWASVPRKMATFTFCEYIFRRTSTTTCFCTFRFCHGRLASFVSWLITRYVRSASSWKWPSPKSGALEMLESCADRCARLRQMPPARRRHLVLGQQEAEGRVADQRLDARPVSAVGDDLLEEGALLDRREQHVERLPRVVVARDVRVRFGVCVDRRLELPLKGGSAAIRTPPRASAGRPTARACALLRARTRPSFS